ncbi:MAG: class 3 adenylate cyclase/predicted ATPase, partial [Hyphomicrobiaceae bacterium]
DLVDATQLSSRLDPEDYGDLLHRYQEMAARVVQRFDCHIAQMLGDGILVYAGYPVAHEDSAERAIRVGLGILEQLPVLNEELARSGQRLSLRIGVHTGLVVVGDIDQGAQREELALGQTPNVAARIQSIAAPDTVVVSAATHRLLGNQFESENLGQHRLKGVAEPMTAYRISGESSNRGAHVGSGGEPPTTLVGRTAELGQLKEALAAAVAGHGRTVLMVGEAGIGKTRVVQALCEEAGDTTHNVLECRGSPHYQDTPLHVIKNTVNRLLGWSERDEPAARLVLLEQALAAYPLVLEEVVPLFAPPLFLTLPEERYLKSTLSPQRRRKQLLDALLAIVSAESRTRPLLIVFEDLQWLDPTSLELLERLIAEVAELPVLLLLTCRPEFTPTWVATPAMVTLHLERLDALDITRLVEYVAGPVKLPPDTVKQIVGRADGVPLFVEEVTKAVLESGPSTSSIPSSLHDSLMARLDRVDSAKSVALDAAVIGREFELPLLQAVSPLEPATLEYELRRLVEAGLLLAMEHAQGTAYTFRHVLIRDVAYDSILKRSRREIHRRIAESLETGFPIIRDEQPELLARHFFEARMGEKALRYWQQAGANADARSAYVEATRHFTRALEALVTLPETDAQQLEHAELLINLGRARAIVSGWGATEVEEAFSQALEISQRVGDKHLAFIALSGLRTHCVLLGKLRRGQQLAEELLAVALDAGRPAEILVARGLLGDSLYRLGQIDLAVAQLERCRRLVPTWEAEPSYAGEDPRVHGLSHLSLALWINGHPARALACSNEAVALARALDHPLSLAYALRFAADLNQRFEEPDAVRASAEELLALAAEQGFAHHTAIGSILRGWARAMVIERAGEPEESAESGIAEMHRGLETYKSTGAFINLPFFLGILAEACARHGELEEGLALTYEALVRSGETEEHWWDAEILRTRGVLIERLALSGRPATGEDAEAYYRKALMLAREQGARALELRAATALGAWLLRGLRVEEARAPLAALVADFSDGYESRDLTEARALLAQMSA